MKWYQTLYAVFWGMVIVFLRIPIDFYKESKEVGTAFVLYRNAGTKQQIKGAWNKHLVLKHLGLNRFERLPVDPIALEKWAKGEKLVSARKEGLKRIV